MRVLMLGKGWFPSQLGGLERYYRELLEHLPEARGVVIGPAEDASQRITAVSQESSPLLVRLLAFMRAARREGLNSDVVDAHFALYAFLPLFIGRLRRKPLLVHFQGPWADENVLVGDSSRWRWLLRRQLERVVYCRAELVVTLTAAFRRLLVERYGVSPWKTTVIPPGVDLKGFSPGDRLEARARFGLPPDVFVACCARRLVPRMGLSVLIEAWASVVTLHRDARLLIAGDGELREVLGQEIASRSLDESVALLGPVSNEDLVALYRAADVNVVPSTSFEGFGLVVLEAAACGTPSVVTRAGGLPEAVYGLGRDLAVPPANVAALADRLAAAAYGKLPSREHTRVWAERHGWGEVALAHRELISRITARHGGSSRKLRVVYLDHVAQLSGGEIALLRLLSALTDVEPHVILAEEGPLVERLSEAGVSVEVLPFPQRTNQLRKEAVRAGRLPLRAVLDTLRYTIKVASRLRQLRPEIVHTNSLKSGIYGSIAARLTGTPAVWHLRDRIDRAYLPPLAIHVITLLTRHLPTAVITNSRATMQTVRPAGGSAVIWEAIPDMTIHSDQLEPPRATETSRPLVVGLVGRLAPWKGQDVFLHAFSRAFPLGHEKAVIVGAPLFGDRDAAFAAKLRALAEELGIASRVEFRGHRDNILAELREIDVLVHASTIPEPFGQVVIEGMTAGLPVVASHGGGPDEVITDGVNGFLYPRGDIAALAEILSQLASDPALRGAVGRAARERARDFAPDILATKVTRVYELASQKRIV